MALKRVALQAAVANLTQSQAITVDADGLLVSTGLLTYAYLQNVSATDKVLGRATAGAGSIEEIACTAAGRALIDDADAAAQRTTLGLDTMALQAADDVNISGGAIAGITDLAIADGGTGKSTASTAKAALGVTFFAIASDTLWHSHDAQGQAPYQSWTKIKTMTFTTGISGVLRVKFDLQSDGGLGNPHAKLYKNGVAVGTDQSMSGQGWVTKSEDLTITLADNDTLELWGYVNSGYNCLVQNFRVYYTPTYSQVTNS